MASTLPTTTRIPVFTGVGTSVESLTQCQEQAVADASSPLGSLLLSACHQAFLTELSSLCSEDLDHIDVDLTAFSSPISLLSIPAVKYHHNPVILNNLHSLIQFLRYLTFIDSLASQKADVPFSSALQGNVERNIGVVGFSMGILSACAVASSSTPLTYITYATEIYKAVLWISVRAHMNSVRILKESHILASGLSWSLVFVGLGKEDATSLLSDFNEKNSDFPLCITAVLNCKSVTISGRPDKLAIFAITMDKSLVTVSEPHIDTLYHAPSLLDVRNEVLSDISRRNIRFPTVSDLIVPIISTFTGEPITSAYSSTNLITAIVDMVLLHPVNWDMVTTSLTDRICEEKARVELVNFGPGILTRGIERRLSGHGHPSVSRDLTVSSLQPPSEPIAIVGMAVNMPGAPNIDLLWDVLEKGINTVSPIPESRFHVDSYDTSNSNARTLKSQNGNFMSNPAAFDNKFFNISPREARMMDPQQRVLLHVAQEALDNAGYVPDATKSFQKDAFGCYIGVATEDYLMNLREDMDVYYSTGTLRAFLCGRISYAMNWGGPSVVIDTACSSSLVAVYQACRALENKDCDAALAGGVNVITSPDMFIGLDKGHFLSPTGQCKPFDVSADGYCRSEGCGLFVLKRLSDAVNENDRILGVIKGVEVNQSGKASSITRPSSAAQQALFRRLLGRAGVDPGRVGVVEAHGTGTQTGDKGEMESIRRVFASPSRDTGADLHVTSVKANIGHLEAASGSAALAKLLLMMKHQAIPALVSVKEVNPAIGSLDGIALDREMVPWKSLGCDGQPRVAVLNNFGAAGSNAVLLLEEYPNPAAGRSDRLNSATPFVFAMSGKTIEAVEKMRLQYIEYLENEDNTSIPLSDIAYTATARRQVYGCRLAVSGDSKLGIVEKLKRTPIVRTSPSAKPARVVFVFSGQGSQYMGMGSQLYATCPLFKRHIDDCQSILVQLGFKGILDIILAEDGLCMLEEMEKFQAFQVAIFSLEYALSKLWMSWGLEPVAVVGHSLGEYAALVTAGVLSLKNALVLVAHRARFMVTKCKLKSTGMLAVALDHATVCNAITCDRITIACYNSPGDCVVSGPLDDLRSFKQHLDDHVGCKNILLEVPFGYHASSMDPLMDEFTAFAQTVVVRPPKIPVISNVHGNVVLPGDRTAFTGDYFPRHCRQPVLFTQGIDAYMKSHDPVGLWIEIGPHSACLPMVRSHPNLLQDARFLPSLKKGREPWTVLTESLAQLYLYQVPVRWRDTFAHVPSVSCADVPSYPFSSVDFWVSYQEASPRGTVAKPEPVGDYRMLSSRRQLPMWSNGRVAIFEIPLHSVASFIQGHVVGGKALCPASVYSEAVLASIRLISKAKTPVVLSDIEYTKTLVYNETVDKTLSVVITVLDDDSGLFSVCSSQDSSCEPDVHARGRYQTLFSENKFPLQPSELTQRIIDVTSAFDDDPPEVFSAKTIYEVLFPRVVAYSKEYRTVRSMTITNDKMECYSIVKLPDNYDRGNFVAHPVFVDTLLHISGFLANTQGDVRDAYVCSHVDEITVIPELVDNDAKYGIYCKNVIRPEDGAVIGEVYATKLGHPDQIVAYLKGVEFRKIRLTSLIRVMAMAAEEQSGVPAARHNNASTPSSVATLVESVDYRVEVLRLLAEVCHLDPSSFGIDSELGSLGVDSLMFIELAGKMKTLIPFLNVDDVYKAKTVAELLENLPQSSSNSPSTKQTQIKLSCDYLSTVVKRALAEACGIDPSGLSDDTELNSLGVDSLMYLEVSTMLLKLFPCLDSTSISTCNTIGEIVALLPPSQTASCGPNSPITPPTTDSKVDTARVLTLLANVLGMDGANLRPDDDLHALGLDSLTSIEALHLIQNEFGVTFPNDFLQTVRTPREIEAQLKKTNTPTADAGSTLFEALRLDRPFVPIQVSQNSSATPLFLIHDGSGLVYYYEGLSGLGRSVSGIHNPRFMTSDPWDGVSAMADAYAKIVEAECPSKPVLLGGWSFGGIVAFEMACQLMQRGVQVKGVLLIDSPSPVNHVPLSTSLISSAVVQNVGSRSESTIAKLMKVQFKVNSDLLGRYQPPKLDKYPPLAMLRSKEGLVFDTQATEFTETIPPWLGDRSNPKTAVVGWEGLVGAQMKVWDIPGNHFQPFMPSNVEEVSKRIFDACASLDVV